MKDSGLKANHTIILIAALVLSFWGAEALMAQSNSLPAKPSPQQDVPFTKTFLTLYGSLSGKQDIIAKYDILIANRNSWKDIQGDSWKILKRLNPKIQIYLYQIGSEVNDNYDAKPIEYLNNLGRWNARRPVPCSNINEDHPEFFLQDASGKRLNNPDYPHSWLMDIGLKSYQDYWLQATIQDIVQQHWVADGVFLDNCFTLCQYAKPVKYPTDASWISAMHQFINVTTAGLHAVGQKTCCNRGGSRRQDGYDAYVALDESANPPDVVYDEGVFAVNWGKGDVQFYAENDWKREVDVIGAVRHSKITVQSHCKLASGKSGTDNYNRPVTFYDVLWYALCSYQLGKNEFSNNSYFCFTRGTYQLSATNMPWYDEMDGSKLNLGQAVGSYQIQKVANNNIYVREFARGYIYVNPTKNDVNSIPLKEACKQLNHDNFQNDPATIPNVIAIDLASHRGTMLLKAGVAKPRNGVFHELP